MTKHLNFYSIFGNFCEKMSSFWQFFDIQMQFSEG